MRESSAYHIQAICPAKAPEQLMAEARAQARRADLIRRLDIAVALAEDLHKTVSGMGAYLEEHGTPLP